MNPESLVVEAWLQADTRTSRGLECATEENLAALAARLLSEPETRRLTMHMASCRECRRAVAGLVSAHALPTSRSGRLPAILLAGVTEAWRDWMRRLVIALPQTDEELAASTIFGYKERSPTRIDERGRLIVDLVQSENTEFASTARVSLASDGTTLDLCTVTVRQGRLYAAIDLSRFQPRAGILQPGVLALEPITVDNERLMSLLIRLQDEGIRGTEFWDRFSPFADGCGSLASLLADEIAVPESDVTTRAARLRSSDGAIADKTHFGRVQYALAAIEEFAAVWSESNGAELEGAAEAAAELRLALAPFQSSAAETRTKDEPVAFAAERLSRPAPQVGRRETL